MWRKLTLLTVIMVLLSGCANYERTVVAPKEDLGGASSIAVLFFDNYTDDYGIAYEMEEQISRKLSEHYQVVEPVEAEWALVRLGLRRGVMPTPDQAVRLGKLLRVDALLVGELSAYFAPVTQTQPYISKTRTNEEGEQEVRWEISRTTMAMVGFSGRILSTRTGNVIYRERVEGENTIVHKETVGHKWYPAGKRPDRIFIPRVSNVDVPAARAAAVNQAANRFTADLLPTYVWRRVQ